jgi:hypothetical protein
MCSVHWNWADASLAGCCCTGVLRVIIVHGMDGRSSTTEYTLLPGNGTRYSLLQLPSRQWRTGMRIRVTGTRTAGLQTATVGVAPTAGSIVVQDVMVVPPTSPPKGVASATAPLTAPATMRVLFVIITMCNQAPSITPSVSPDSLVGRQLHSFCCPWAGQVPVPSSVPQGLHCCVIQIETITTMAPIVTPEL